MPSDRHCSRRNFLARASAGTAALIAAPMIIPRSAFGANDRIRLGFIGVRNQGTNNLKSFLPKSVDIPVLCDVDSESPRTAMELLQQQNRPFELVTDFRRVLDRRDIDAVVVTTPDHWHAPIVIAACAAGKDVYCEKPLSLTIAEGRGMVTAARAAERIVQTGSQQRSTPEFRRACELVRSGALGEVKLVTAGLPGPNHPGPLGPATVPPKNLNYDFWLGPAPARDYHEKRVHYNFRFWWDYSGGQMTNFGAHHLDIAQWGLGRDLSGPVAIDGEATFHPEHVHEVTETCRITFTYDDGAKLIAGQQQEDIAEGVTFIGSEGRIHVTRGRLTSDPPDIAERAEASLSQRLPVSDDHHQNFLDCVGSRDLPIADVEIGHRSATVCHLGNFVARLGRGLRWNPESERVIGDDEAQAMTERPSRDDWKST